MTAPSVSSSLSGLSSLIGRYFTVVSIVPSLLLVFWIVFIAGSGAWSGTPNWSRSADSLTRISLSGAFVLVLMAVALGAVLHPLQFMLVQFLEGYWGTSSIAVRLRAMRTAGYDQFRRHLVEMQVDTSSEREQAERDEATELQVRQDEAERQLMYFPSDPRWVMPTRLGNVLRKYETDAGSEYGLSALVFTEHLIHVAPPEHVRYVNDQRTALDFAVKCCLIGLVGSTVAVIFLWQHGMWLALTAVPYLVAYGSYRGAVVAAHQYGRALEVLVTLNRFALYERLRLALPKDTVEERAVNEKLTSLTKDHAEEENLPHKYPETQADTV